MMARQDMVGKITAEVVPFDVEDITTIVRCQMITSRQTTQNQHGEMLCTLWG
jgi:hypothetical protein